MCFISSAGIIVSDGKCARWNTKVEKATQVFLSPFQLQTALFSILATVHLNAKSASLTLKSWECMQLHRKLNALRQTFKVWLSSCSRWNDSQNTEESTGCKILRGVQTHNCTSLVFPLSSSTVRQELIFTFSNRKTTLAVLWLFTEAEPNPVTAHGFCVARAAPCLFTLTVTHTGWK